MRYLECRNAHQHGDTAGFAAGAADLSAGYVSYTDINDAPITALSANAAVKASTTISNAGDAPANAVVWTATYDNGVLVSTAYSAVSVPGGGQCTRFGDDAGDAGGCFECSFIHLHLGQLH